MWRLAIHFTQYSLSSEFLADWSLQSFVLLTLRFWQEDNTPEGMVRRNTLIKSQPHSAIKTISTAAKSRVASTL